VILSGLLLPQIRGRVVFTLRPIYPLSPEEGRGFNLLATGSF